jgi:hypothetical protein
MILWAQAVPQDAVLLGETIGDNLPLALEAVTDAELWAVLHVAVIDDRLVALLDGLNVGSVRMTSDFRVGSVGASHWVAPILLLRTGSFSITSEGLNYESGFGGRTAGQGPECITGSV